MLHAIEAVFEKLGIQGSLYKNGQEILFRCPFHNDHRASMSMNTTTTQYHCFSCGAGGGSLKSFIEKLTGEKIDFRQFVKEEDELIAKINAIYKTSADNILCYENDADFQLRFNEEFTNFIPATKSEVAYSYLKDKRKLSDATIQAFRLKYAVRGDYESRVIIPYFSKTTLLGFNSRLIGADKAFLKDLRYRYLINTAAFKGYIYNYENLVGNDYCILVEGPFDLMWMVQCGFKNVISTLTTRVDYEHIFNLTRFKNFIFCFDNDDNNAGYNAVMKASEMIHNCLPDRNIMFMALPPGSDPNECSKETLEFSMKRLRRITFE